MNNTLYSASRLTAEHANQWQALRLRGVQDFPLGFLLTKTEAASLTLHHLAKRLDAGNDWGIFHNTTLVGFCSYRPQTLERIKHRAEIGPFFIDPAHHGTAAARLLMDTIIDTARSTGIEQLELFVDTENHRAIRFYEKIGFNRVAMHPNGVKIDGVARDDYFYILRLTS